MKRYYFPHDYGARNDSKILRLRSEFGLEGYAVYFCLLEMTCEADGELDVSHLPSLAMALNTDVKHLASTLQLCCEIGLFDCDGAHIRSARLDRHLAAVNAMSKGGRNSAEIKKLNKDGTSVSTLQAPCNDLETTLGKRKEIKENEIKEKEKSNIYIIEESGDRIGGVGERKEVSRFAPPLFDVLLSFVASLGGTQEQALSIFDFYTSNGWKVGKNPMKDWQAACRNWLRREEKESKPKKQSWV